MFRLVNYDDEGAGELFRYLSETASKVIWNALNIWGGSIPAILDIYLTEFAGLPIGEADADFFDGISRYISTDIVRQDIKAMTERLKMSNRPKNPANARNKNVLIVGGSGSGKTRFWIKPNLLQLHSSYVLTDPKGTTLIEVGHAFVRAKYQIKIFNTINFRKSMHYNPFAYVHSEKDILKLVTTLMANTKGEGKGSDPFWDKAETLL